MSKDGKIAWNPRFGPAANARRQLPPLVRAYFAQVRASLAADPPPAQLHAIRLATKRLRYTLELFRPCYGPGLKTRLAALQSLQQILGEVNDCVAAEHLLTDLVPASATRNRVARFLRDSAAAKALALRQGWRESFDAPGREQWWLRYLANGAGAWEPRLRARRQRQSRLPQSAL